MRHRPVRLTETILRRIIQEEIKEVRMATPADEEKAIQAAIANLVAHSRNPMSIGSKKFNAAMRTLRKMIEGIYGFDGTIEALEEAGIGEDDAFEYVEKAERNY